MACVYKVTNIITGKKYIGYTKNLRERKNRHKYNALHKNSPFLFHKSIRKHGWENFKWEVIYENDDDNYCLTVMEPLLIEENNTLTPNGYNMDKGGRKGMIGLKRGPVSEEVKKKISETLKKTGLKGKDHPMYGTKANDKFIQSAKISMLGKSHSAETKKNQSESRKEYLKYNKVGMFGKQHSDDTKQKMKLKRMEKWELYDKETKQTILIEDLMKYSQLNNIKYKTIYSWKYKIIDGQPRLKKV